MKIIILFLILIVYSCRSTKPCDCPDFSSNYVITHGDHLDTLTQEEYLSNLDTAWSVTEITTIKYVKN